jgi:AraC-like DNA-binding protein
MKKQVKPILLKVVPEVKNVFEKNYAADSVDTIAINYSISRNTLQDAFKQECGVGIREYKLKQRMEAARKMLNEGKGIKEIAFTLKYGTISAFSRAFKKYYKITPTECINEVRNVY